MYMPYDGSKAKLGAFLGLKKKGGEMINLYTGVPGSGKTYRMVYDLLKLPVGKYFVFHNIDGLKEDVIEQGEFIQEWTEIPSFLTREKQKTLSDQIRSDTGRKMLVIIDEAWEFLGKKARTEPDALAWLKMHRHMDQQVWICTQSYKDLSQAVYDVIPVEIRAKRGIIGSQYVYQHNVRGETFRTERIPKKEAVYHSYTSFQGTGEKVKTTKVLWVALALLAIFIWAGFYSFSSGIQGTFTPEAAASAVKPAKVKEAPPLKTVKTAVPVVPLAPPRPLQEYSFAGCAGASWWAQELNGGKLVKGNDLYPEYSVTQCGGKMVVLMSGQTGVVRLTQKKKINIPETASTGETMPPAGSKGEAKP